MVLGRVDGEFADELAGRVVDDADLEVVGEDLAVGVGDVVADAVVAVVSEAARATRRAEPV